MENNNEITTTTIQKYVVALYNLFPRSKMWGRFFHLDHSVMSELADKDPDIIDTTVPPGVGVEIKRNTVMGNLLAIFAIALAKVDKLVYNMNYEAEPTTAVDMLTEWESVYNLETVDTDPVSDRQDRLDAFIQDRSKIRTVEYLKNLAQSHGASIDIEEVIDTPWTGEIGGQNGDDLDIFGGQCGAMTVGNVNSSGVIYITIQSNPDHTYEELVQILTPNILTACLLYWIDNSTDGGEIIQTTDAEEIIQTTFSITDIIQGMYQR